MTDDMFNGKVRDRSPETSWDAAALQTLDRSHAVQSTISVLLGTRGPLTDEELVDAYEEYRLNRPWISNVTPQSVRTRRHEMRIAGKIRDTGQRRPTRAGSTAIVWQINPVGETSEATA